MKNFYIKLFTYGLCVIAVNLMVANVSAFVITGEEYPFYTHIDDEFKSSGILLSSNMGYVTFGLDGGRRGIYGTDPSGWAEGSYLRFNAPIELTFVNLAESTSRIAVNGTISAVWGDGGGDTDYMRLRAYDFNDQLIDTVYDEGSTWQTISFTGSNISSIIFDQQPGAPFSSDTFLDNLTVNVSSVPIPGALWLLFSGISVIVMLRFRGE